MAYYVGGIVPSKTKIIMLAKRKFEGISRQIDEIMMNTSCRKTLMRGLSNEL